MGNSVEAAIGEEPARSRDVRSSQSTLSFWKCPRTQADASCKPRPARRSTVAEAVEPVAKAVRATDRPEAVLARMRRIEHLVVPAEVLENPPFL
ncbi:MAG: hypothetical protein WBN40_07340 [Pseudomonadales bacterium]